MLITALQRMTSQLLSRVHTQEKEGLQRSLRPLAQQKQMLMMMPKGKDGIASSTRLIRLTPPLSPLTCPPSASGYPSPHCPVQPRPRRCFLLPQRPTMSAAVARMQHAQQLSRFLARAYPRHHPGGAVGAIPCQRRALMSALSHPPPPIDATPSAPRSLPIPEQTPFVEPGATPLSKDAASPQVAARPPQPPKAERAKPTLRATKAAITVVSIFSSHALCPFLHLPPTFSRSVQDLFFLFFQHPFRNIVVPFAIVRR
jgi:hypothetical protein